MQDSFDLLFSICGLHACPSIVQSQRARPGVRRSYRLQSLFSIRFLSILRGTEQVLLCDIDDGDDRKFVIRLVLTCGLHFNVCIVDYGGILRFARAFGHSLFFHVHFAFFNAARHAVLLNIVQVCRQYGSR